MLLMPVKTTTTTTTTRENNVDSVLPKVRQTTENVQKKNMQRKKTETKEKKGSLTKGAPRVRDLMYITISDTWSYDTRQTANYSTLGSDDVNVWEYSGRH